MGEETIDMIIGPQKAPIRPPFSSYIIKSFKLEVHCKNTIFPFFTKGNNDFHWQKEAREPSPCFITPIPN